jgi:hypothetical protein
MELVGDKEGGDMRRIDPETIIADDEVIVVAGKDLRDTLSFTSDCMEQYGKIYGEFRQEKTARTIG